MDNRKMIYLDDALDAVEKESQMDGAYGYMDTKSIVDLLSDLPSAQPEERALHESCTDCPLYDKDRHSCPRFNKVIPETLRELQSAQPERETAKFIRWMECKKTANYISYTPHCKCSKCGTEFLIETIKYCYMCGARMER